MEECQRDFHQLETSTRANETWRLPLIASYTKRVSAFSFFFRCVNDATCALHRVSNEPQHFVDVSNWQQEHDEKEGRFRPTSADVGDGGFHPLQLVLYPWRQGKEVFPVVLHWSWSAGTTLLGRSRASPTDGPHKSSYVLYRRSRSFCPAIYW